MAREKNPYTKYKWWESVTSSVCLDTAEENVRRRTQLCNMSVL